MKVRRNRVVAVAAGASAVATTLGATALALAAPASAAPTYLDQACASSTTLSPTAVAAKYAAANGALGANYLKSANGKKLHAATLAASKAYAKAKKSGKAAALKKLNAAKKAEAAGLAVYKKSNTVLAFTGTNTPAPISVSGTSAANYPGKWNWGSYTTTAFVKAGKVVDVCMSVDQSADQNDATPPKVANASDKQTSITTYQGIQNDPTSAKTNSVPVGNSWVLIFAALAAPANTATAVNGNVSTCAVLNWNAAPTSTCIYGGLSDPASPTHLTGATYTVQGFEASLQAALQKAATAKAIGA